MRAAAIDHEQPPRWWIWPRIASRRPSGDHATAPTSRVDHLDQRSAPEDLVGGEIDAREVQPVVLRGERQPSSVGGDRGSTDEFS